MCYYHTGVSKLTATIVGLSISILYTTVVAPVSEI